MFDYWSNIWHCCIKPVFHKVTHLVNLSLKIKKRKFIYNSLVIKYLNIFLSTTHGAILSWHWVFEYLLKIKECIILLIPKNVRICCIIIILNFHFYNLYRNTLLGVAWDKTWNFNNKHNASVMFFFLIFRCSDKT